MNILKITLASAVTALSFTAPSFAQEGEFTLPEQCTRSSGMEKMDHASMGHGNAKDGMGDDKKGADAGDLENAPEHVQENMRKMMITMPAMEEGMMNEDPDVAFACGMIAHHQGAIDMAQVLLDHGDDPEMIKLAEDIMAAQFGEIEQMKKWLVENAD